MKYIVLGFVTTSALLGVFIAVWGLVLLVRILANDPSWVWVVPVILIAITLGVVVGGVEYLTERKPGDGQ